MMPIIAASGCHGSRTDPKKTGAELVAAVGGHASTLPTRGFHERIPESQ